MAAGLRPHAPSRQPPPRPAPPSREPPGALLGVSPGAELDPGRAARDDVGVLPEGVVGGEQLGRAHARLPQAVEGPVDDPARQPQRLVRGGARLRAVLPIRVLVAEVIGDADDVAHADALLRRLRCRLGAAASFNGSNRFDSSNRPSTVEPLYRTPTPDVSKGSVDPPGPISTPPPVGRTTPLTGW